MVKFQNKEKSKIWILKIFSGKSYKEGNKCPSLRRITGSYFVLRIFSAILFFIISYFLNSTLNFQTSMYDDSQKSENKKSRNFRDSNFTVNLFSGMNSNVVSGGNFQEFRFYLRVNFQMVDKLVNILHPHLPCHP
jgi:hypothetical protein